VVYVFDADPRSSETITDRFSREPCTMLTAIEALLLDSSNKIAVTNDGRRRVAVICVES